MYIMIITNSTQLEIEYHNIPSVSRSLPPFYLRKPGKGKRPQNAKYSDFIGEESKPSQSKHCK